MKTKLIISLKCLRFILWETNSLRSLLKWNDVCWQFNGIQCDRMNEVYNQFNWSDSINKQLKLIFSLFFFDYVTQNNCSKCKYVESKKAITKQKLINLLLICSKNNKKNIYNLIHLHVEEIYNKINKIQYNLSQSLVPP